MLLGSCHGGRGSGLRIRSGQSAGIEEGATMDWNHDL